MAPASNEEQFKFLISCIRYSNNGKVDFGQVAKECKIVSKGAAAKRYERMMRSHGIAPNAAAIKPAPSRMSKSERLESTPSSSSSSAHKKRKVEGYLDENTTADDDERFGTVKPEPAVTIKEQLVVKEEKVPLQQQQHQQPGQLSLGEAADLMQYYETPCQYSAGGLSLEDSYGGQYTTSQSYGAGMGGTSGTESPYGLGSQQTYSFPSHSPYGSSEVRAGLGGMHIGESQSMPYQPLIKYSSDEQGRGRPDSPLIVE
ncbi:unnamed protein product [Diplocarpon coronariae]|uniref:Myb-like DNA-binding domain-containing protein n=1 Tax=Diplocarpon coronariae TaxID=2795749 RepID=A0A218YUX9_9HELO|nr:hypothetical protein B2J93_5815 [Marssonina coronariae]